MHLASGGKLSDHESNTIICERYRQIFFVLTMHPFIGSGQHVALRNTANELRAADEGIIEWRNASRWRAGLRSGVYEISHEPGRSFDLRAIVRYFQTSFFFLSILIERVTLAEDVICACLVYFKGSGHSSTSSSRNFSVHRNFNALVP